MTDERPEHTPHTNAQAIAGVSNRLGRVEENQQLINRSLGEVTTELSFISQQFGSIKSSIERINQGSSWRTLIAPLGLVLTIVASVGGLYASMQNRHVSLQFQHLDSMSELRHSAQQKELDLIETNLARRHGKRWNKPDQIEFEHRLQDQLAGIEAQIKELRAKKVRLLTHQP